MNKSGTFKSNKSGRSDIQDAQNYQSEDESDQLNDDFKFFDECREMDASKNGDVVEDILSEAI